MPELLTIADQPVINYTNRELLEGPQPLVDERFAEMIAAIDDFNQFPVKTLERRYVLGQGGILSDREIKVGLAIGHIVCDPLPGDNSGARINGSSIDVTLGHYFYRAGQKTYEGRKDLFNPFSQEDTLRYFNVDDTHPEKGAFEAKPWAEVKAKLGRTGLKAFDQYEHIEGIPDHQPMILLRPNERILAHTHESIGIRPPGTTAMQARSTTGRIGASVCYCAGWGDPGFIARWTMEIHNLNEDEFLPLPVGWRIAQVVFSTTGPVGIEYSQVSGNYQHDSSSDLTVVKRNWSPELLLPRAYNNEIVLPKEVDGLSGGLK